VGNFYIAKYSNVHFHPAAARRPHAILNPDVALLSTGRGSAGSDLSTIGVVYPLNEIGEN
jgi:hypothetical protein